MWSDTEVEILKSDEVVGAGRPGIYHNKIYSTIFSGTQCRYISDWLYRDTNDAIRLDRKHRMLTCQ